MRFFEAFTDFYPFSTFPLNIIKTEIRFINGIEVTAEDKLLPFLADKLHTKIEFDPNLFAPNKVQASPEGVTLNMGFEIEEPEGKAMLGLGSGEIMDRPAMLQQMVFYSMGESAPQDLGALDPWLDAMHKIAKGWFETLCRGELMKRFI